MSVGARPHGYAGVTAVGVLETSLPAAPRAARA